MLHTLAVLLLFQCLGEGVAFVFRLPVPGPVIGMLLLFATLLLKPRLHALVEPGATELLRHLSLLFVPAGAGVVAVGASIGGQWLALLGALAGGTLITLALTAAVLRALTRGRGKAPDA
jgi:holin-like protein